MKESRKDSKNFKMTLQTHPLKISIELSKIIWHWQPSLTTFVRVGAVAPKATVGQDGANLAVEVDGVRRPEGASEEQGEGK
jgi:hypothetical protein